MKTLHKGLFAAVTLAVLALAPGDASAQTVASVTFDTVTGFKSSYVTFSVTGQLHGASVTSTQEVVWNETLLSTAQACEPMILFVIDRPGRFSLTIGELSGGLICSVTAIPAGS